MNNASPITEYRRSPWTAAILSLLMPGLGQVYTGALAQGLVWMFLCGIFSVTGLLFLSFPSAYSWTLGCVAELSLVVIWLAAAVDSRRLALRCKPDYELKDYNRWYAYVLLLFLGTGGPLAYALDVRNQLIQPFKIPTASMYPTILPNDRVIAVKNAYQTADPQRGDMVLFVYPDDRRVLNRVTCMSTAWSFPANPSGQPPPAPIIQRPPAKFSTKTTTAPGIGFSSPRKSQPPILVQSPFPNMIVASWETIGTTRATAGISDPSPSPASRASLNTAIGRS